MKRSRKILQPALIILCIGMLVWLSGCTPRTTKEPDDTKAAKEKPPTVEPTQPKGNPNWFTYHGSNSLTGAVDIVLPEKPVLRWRFNAGEEIINSPVATGERIFFATNKGKVFALDYKGKEIWQKQLLRGEKDDGTPIKERIDAPVACFKSTLLVGTGSGKLYALDTATGDVNWVYDVESPLLGTANIHPVSAKNKIENDRVYVIDQSDGTLHSIDLASGKRLWTTDGVNRCDGSAAVGDGFAIFGSCAAALHVYSASDGKLVKNIEIDGDSQVAGGVALTGDSVFSGSHSGKLIHASIKTGKIVWINDDSESEVYTTPAVKDNWVVFGSNDDNIYALDRKTGKLKWKYESDDITTSPVISSDKVVVGIGGTVYLLNLEDGKELWSYEVSDLITSPAIINDMIVVGSEDGTVNAFGIKLN